MDLADINIKKEAEDGAVFEIRHPITDAPLIGPEPEKKPFQLRLAGKFSDRYIKQQRALTDRRLKKSVGRRKVTVTADQLEREEAETLARCVIDGYIVVDGKPVENTFEGWYALFTDERFTWLTDAVSEFLVDEQNFTAKS